MEEAMTTNERPPGVDKLLNISKFAVEREVAINSGRIDISIKLIDLLHKTYELSNYSRSNIYDEMEDTVIAKINSLLSEIKIKDD